MDKVAPVLGGLAGLWAAYKIIPAPRSDDWTTPAGRGRGVSLAATTPLPTSLQQGGGAKCLFRSGVMLEQLELGALGVPLGDVEHFLNCDGPNH